LAIVPGEAAASIIRRAVNGIEPADVLTLPWCDDGATELRGPAALYFGPDRWTAKQSVLDVREVSNGGGDRLISNVSAADAEESGISRATRVFALRVAGTPVALAGYRHWPGGIAHMSVLTSADERRRGYGRAAS
jgi:hypothetical protein